MKKSVIITICIFSIVVLAFLVSLLFRWITKFRYEKNLDETVITVDSNDITLREFGYYIYTVEDFVQAEALAYDSENPTQWWNTHFSAGMDSEFVCDTAKETAINMCVCREVYFEEAKNTGMTLSKKEVENAASEAVEIYRNLNSYQRSKTGLTKEIILECKKKETLGSKYANSLTETIDFEKLGLDPETELNWDGNYYKGNILSMHDVEKNDRILDNIIMGKITVNYD